MRFMMIMLPNVPGIDEENWTPDPEAVSAMGGTTRSSRKPACYWPSTGCTRPPKGARVSFAGGSPSMTDGPFAEAKELIGGYWMIEAASKEEAVRVGLALPGGPTATRSRFARSSRRPTSRPRCRTPAGSRRAPARADAARA